MSVLHDQGSIPYLMRRKFPLYGQIDGYRYGKSSGLPLDARKRLMHEMELYEKELEALSPSALRARVTLQKKKEATAEEAARPFNRPEASADYAHAVTLGWWSAEEAAAYLLGKDPANVTWSVVESHVGSSLFADAFRLLRERIARSPLVKQPEVAPRQWIEWASSQAIPIPAAAHEALSQSKQEKGLSASERPLEMRERDTLLSIIIVMSMELGHEPFKRSPFPKRIADNMELLTLGRSEDTVRKYIKRGEELLPGEWPAKWAKRRKS